MLAKLSDNYRFSRITALGGLEFVKGHYSPVPAGLEEQAVAHSDLDIKDEDEATTLGEFSMTEPAHKLIVDNGIDPNDIEATGADGRILKSDVERYLSELQ